MKLFLAVAIALGFCAQAWATPIYVFKEPDGSVRFSSRPPPVGVSAKVFTGRSVRYVPIRKGAGWSYSYSNKHWSAGRQKLYSGVFSEIISAAAKRYRLGIDLVHAVIHIESGFNPRAVSPKGALGLMQLMPGTARLHGVTNALSPAQNINGGARHLAYLLRKFDGNEKWALAAYNAGDGAVQKYNGIPPYEETQTYVQRVLEMKHRYSMVLKG